jgi:hypothetical protein
MIIRTDAQMPSSAESRAVRPVLALRRVLIPEAVDLSTD